MAEIIGNDGFNILIGTAAPDTIYGLGGNDDIQGQEGNDTIYGDGRAPGVIDPGFRSGARILPGVISPFEPYGNDSLNGGAGDDTLIAGDGNDILRGNAGNDLLDGGNGIDWATYGDAVAAVVVNLGGQTATGGGGNDVLKSIEVVDGSNFNDIMSGDSRDNTLRGGNGNDNLFGLDGNDQLAGKLGVDRLFGEGGDDILSELDGGNLLDGGAGRDQAFFLGANAPLNVDLAAGTCTLGGVANTLVSIQDITGANGVNTLLGNGSGNLLNGFNFDDFMDGRAGNDNLHGQGGADTLYGANGDDYIDGGSGNDRLHGQDGDDVMLGREGDDNIVDAVGGNTITAGDGNDYVLGSGTVDGNVGDDDLQGFGTTLLRGGLGHDHVRCGTGAQRVVYESTADDDPSAAAARFVNEIVFDFNRNQGDRFDVATIDANENIGGNQAFTFVGTAPVDQAGEIGILVSGGVTYVVAETNGALGPDLQVQMSNSVINAAGDFIL